MSNVIRLVGIIESKLQVVNAVDVDRELMDVDGQFEELRRLWSDGHGCPWLALN